MIGYLSIKLHYLIGYILNICSSRSSSNVSLEHNVDRSVRVVVPTNVPIIVFLTNLVKMCKPEIGRKTANTSKR